MDIILSIDKDVAVHDLQTAEWKKYNIDTLRVDTINEAINLLKNGKKFLFVCINEDTIPNFMSQLPILRDITNTPIFIITSSYTAHKKIRAMRYGADVYDPFCSSAEENVLSALELLKLRNRFTNSPSLSVLIANDIVLSLSRRIVFLKDTEVHLTKKEFDILLHLMRNNGNVVTHIQLLQKIWGEEYSEYDANVLWRTVNRLRTKLTKISPEKEYIKAERGVGYKIIP